MMWSVGWEDYRGRSDHKPFIFSTWALASRFLLSRLEQVRDDWHDSLAESAIEDLEHAPAEVRWQRWLGQWKYWIREYE